ncbi:MAG: DUF3011 domain-containing protein [Candidatus Competibacteraceae bacterium]|nr:DUF3011 domain-containing protein [Candidatus Competibacteraceae bacterium]HRY16419.1 DUF3011 domain-containing protein [Candidatus Competibacteraceae bacterium]
MKTKSILAFSALSLVLTSPPVVAARTVTCESIGNERNVCRVDHLRDQKVRVRRTLSHSPCIEGRSWGVDRRGIWVDRGCRAEFEIGNDDNKSNNAAAAVAVGVGLAALAVALSSDNKDDNRHQSSRDDAPDFVYRVCNREALQQVQTKRHGRYASLSRVEKVHRTDDGWRLKAYYELRFDRQTYTEPAVCEVNNRQQVTLFQFK